MAKVCLPTPSPWLSTRYQVHNPINVMIPYEWDNSQFRTTLYNEENDVDYGYTWLYCPSCRKNIHLRNLDYEEGKKDYYCYGKCSVAPKRRWFRMQMESHLHYLIGELVGLEKTAILEEIPSDVKILKVSSEEESKIYRQITS